MAKISICIPWHFMENWQFFLTRCLKSIEAQTFKDYEVILTKAGSMPVNSNRAIESAQGELIKILYMDDYLAHGNALQEIVDNFTKESTWLVTGCLHDDGKNVGNYHEPSWNNELYTGINSIGSPSVLTMRREGSLFFDDKLSWLLDCDLYTRLYDLHGPPTLLKTPNVVIGIGVHQTTYHLDDDRKKWEYEYVKKKHKDKG